MTLLGGSDRSVGEPEALGDGRLCPSIAGWLWDSPLTVGSLTYGLQLEDSASRRFHAWNERYVRWYVFKHTFQKKYSKNVRCCWYWFQGVVSRAQGSSALTPTCTP